MSRNNRGGGNRSLMEFIAFIAVVLMGIWLAIHFIINQTGWVTLEGRMVNLLNFVAIALGAVVALYYSYFWARNAKWKGWFIVWVIALILVVVFLILGIAL